MDGVVFIEFDNGVWGRGVSLLFSWPPVREVCTNDEVVMFQPGTGKPPELGSIDNCYIAILLILDLPFYDRHPMSAWGGYPLMPLPPLPFRPSCIHTGSFAHDIRFWCVGYGYDMIHVGGTGLSGVSMEVHEIGRFNSEYLKWVGCC